MVDAAGDRISQSQNESEVVIEAKSNWALTREIAALSARFNDLQLLIKVVEEDSTKDIIALQRQAELANNDVVDNTVLARDITARLDMLKRVNSRLHALEQTAKARARNPSALIIAFGGRLNKLEAWAKQNAKVEESRLAAYDALSANLDTLNKDVGFIVALCKAHVCNTHSALDKRIGTLHAEHHNAQDTLSARFDALEQALREHRVQDNETEDARLAAYDAHVNKADARLDALEQAAKDQARNSIASAMVIASM